MALILFSIWESVLLESLSAPAQQTTAMFLLQWPVLGTIYISSVNKLHNRTVDIHCPLWPTCNVCKYGHWFKHFLINSSRSCQVTLQPFQANHVSFFLLGSQLVPFWQKWGNPQLQDRVSGVCLTTDVMWKCWLNYYVHVWKCSAKYNALWAGNTSSLF